MAYDHIGIEKKWQQYWEDQQTFKTSDESEKPKYYALDMFPYPSGAGLHVGHPEGYTATDIVARMKTYARIQCTSSDGMGCIWATCRTVCIKYRQ